MNQLPFDQVIKNSPVLSSSVKDMLIENAEKFSEGNKQMIMDKVLDYEKRVLGGIESFLSYLGKD